VAQSGRSATDSTFVIDPCDNNEIQAILNTAQGQVRNLFQFAFFSGLRTSELMAIEWGDIDWLNNIIHVTRAVEKQEKTTKTRAGNRKVLLLLLPPALEALKNHKEMPSKLLEILAGCSGLVSRSEP